MKPAHLQREQKEDDSDDSFDLKEWKKSKTQQIAPPTKKTASDLDGKKTRKYKDDPVMNQIYERILRQSDKFEEQIEKQQEVFEADLYQYNPHIVSGKLENIRKLSAKDKQQWGLGDEGQCHAMEISEKITVVLVGKIGYEPIEGINANIYLPKETYEAIADKSCKQQSQRLIRLKNNRFGIWIKRQLRKDNTSNILSYPYLVIDPQNLLYPSYLCSWISCQRSISLSHYVQGEKDVNQAIVYGSTCHRLLQWLAERLVTVQQYEKSKQDLLKRLYTSMLYDMYLIDRNYDQFLSVCLQRLDNLVNFYHRFIQKGEEMQIDRYKKLYLKIQKLISSQYMFRSNFFGLKGKVDLLLAGQMIDKRKGIAQQVYIPMQLKTGRKVSDSHKRQTQIYNILVRQKYKKSVVGLLYYSDSDIKFFKIQDPLSAFEIILVHRNQIALNLVKLFQSSSIKLPQLAYGFPQCNFCSYSPICQLSYTKIEQRSIQDIEQLPSKYHKNIKPVQQIYSQSDSQYINRWFKMIHLEETQFKKINTDYWKMGISFFRLQYTELTNLNRPQTKARLELIHKCKKQEQLSIFQDFYKISMKVRIVANTINLIEGCKIISTIREQSTKQFRIIIQMNNEAIEFSPNKLIFFIQQQQDVDVDIETFENSSFAGMRSTVLGVVSNQTFLKDLLIDNKINKQIIDLPDSEEQQQSTVPKIQVHDNDYKGLNEDQKKAFRKAVLQNRFCLIEGMPGTGKTELIIRLIQKFHKNKKTILITTFTNRALDNILERLLESDKVDKSCIIRQGSQYSCSKLLKQFTSHSRKFATLQDYKQYYGSKKIWFVTLSSLYIHHLPKLFDITILDQASQCLEPVCIEALLKAEKFVLIGDYKQLQPVVKSKEAFKKGMCISLFQRLCKAFPTNTVSLTKQYRMNNKIMALSNKLVYNGELSLGNQNNRQKIIKLNQSWQNHIPHSFLNIILPQNSIVFLNYDPIIDSITKKYRQKQPMIRKIIQAQLSVFIYRTFITLGFPQSNMSIIAAMNSSVNKIIELLKQSKTISQNNGSILTIDKSQGIDKEIIILLIQRGNQELIENPRRLNVALTRAKSKLIIIGSDEQLSKMKIWQGTLGKMLREYQIELNKGMIQDMIEHIEHKS